jgi:hypothetical protein
MLWLCCKQRMQTRGTVHAGEQAAVIEDKEAKRGNGKTGSYLLN